MKTKKNENDPDRKPKLSLQKKSKTASSRTTSKLLVAPEDLLNETNEFQNVSKKTSCRNIKKDQTKKVSLVKNEEKSEMGHQGHIGTETEVQGHSGTEMEDDETYVTESVLRCPTCKSEFSKEKIQHHFKQCLRSKFQKSSGTAVSLQQTSETKMMEQKDENFFCQFCQKDLSHLKSTRKTQHLNRCMDKVEETRNDNMEKEKALEQAKMSVLDCPMCGKPLKTQNARKVHLKKCGLNLGVSTDQILMLLKKQEEERQINITAGILPQAHRSGKLKDNKNAKKPKVKEPKSQFDEDLQTAIALSSSITGPKNQEKVQHLKRGKKKKSDEVTPLVILLSEEEKQKRRSERISTMLLPQESDEEDSLDSTPKYKESTVYQKYSSLMGEVQNQIPLWERCELATEKLSGLAKEDKFYVQRLMPPVQSSQFVVGSNIKQLSEIPGRRKSTFTQIKEDPSTCDPLIKDTMLCSTQTAAVLAEMEAGVMETSDLDLTCSGFCPEQPLTIKETLISKTMKSLQESMLTLVNNPVNSDVKIISRDACFSAHKVMLEIRCPALIKDSLQEIRLADFGSEAVMSVLRYVYAGQVLLTNSVLQEVFILANRLDLGELSSICQTLLNDRESNNEKQESESEDLLQRILSVNEEMENPTEVGGDQQTTEKGKVQISPEEYDDIMCTQRIKYSSSEGKDDNLEHSQQQRKPSKSDVDENEISLFFKDDSFSESQSTEACREESDNEDNDESAENDSNVEMIERVSSPISDDISNGQGLVEGEQEEITILSDSDDTPPCSPPKKKTKLGGDNQIQDRKVSMNNIQTCHEDCDTNFKQIENSDVEENKIKCLNISGTQNFKLNQNTDVNFKEAPIGSQCNTQNNQINVKSPFIIESEDSLESILSKDAESIESLSQEKSSQDIATDYSPKHLDSSYVDLFDSSLSTILSTEDPEETSNRTLQGMSSSEKNSELKTSDRTLRQLSSSEKTSKLEVHTDTTLTPLKGYNGGSRSSRLVARKVFEKDSENKIIPQIVTCSAKDKSSSVSLVAVDDEVEIIGENLQEPSCHSVMTNDDEISVIDDNLHEFSHTQQPSPTFSLSKEKKYKFTKSKTKQSHLLSDSFFQNPKVLCGQSKDQDVISASINEHDSCESQFQKSGYCDVLSKRNNEQESHLDQSDGKPNVSFSIDKTETFRDVQHSMDISPSTSQNSDQSLRENVIEIGHSPTQNSDVWEGFDDSGMGACLIQCDTPVTSPKSDVLTEKKNKNESLSITESQKNPTSCLRSPPEHSNGEDQIQTIESCYSQIKNESQTTKVNYSQIQNQSQTNFDDSFGEDSFSVEVYKDTEKEKKQEGSTTETFKTPVLSKKSPTKKWIPPSPFTPMPEYDKMNTPLLKQEVQKIGVKPVGKKRMLMLLKDVYHQTHQYETDSEFETSVDELNNLPDINSMEEKEASADEGNISSSQESEKSDVLEESVMRISDDEFSSSQTTTEADIEGLHGKISKFIHQRKDIYTKILMYEPLDLDWLKKEITESGTKCSMDKLMNYLDEKCITFTLKNRRKASPKKRRGRGKKKLAESK